ncbi:MAG TPA: exosortase/archaeosortase family protein [Candidatus Limnocylindria bacterium]|nr:exosortase/archaeosortase family protein [Candidatus Limnocylindria bacterium]
MRLFWNSLPHKTAFAVVFALWALLFHIIGNASLGDGSSTSMFGWLYGWYYYSNFGESGDELCPLVPFICLVLVYQKREELTRLTKDLWGPALLVIAAGVLLHVLGYVVQQVRLSAVGFLVGGFGVMGMFWGSAWLKSMLFPWFMLLFGIPVGSYTDSLTYQLRVLSTQLSVGICNGILQMKLIRLGTTVMHASTAAVGGFQFDVAPACSGIRSATVVLLLTLIFSYLNFRSLWRRALLVLLAVPLAVFGNVIRLVVVFIVSDSFGEEAGKMIETKFGFITYLGALAGIYLVSRLLRENRGRPKDHDLPTPTPNAEAAAS